MDMEMKKRNQNLSFISLSLSHLPISLLTPVKAVALAGCSSIV